MHRFALVVLATFVAAAPAQAAPDRAVTLSETVKKVTWTGKAGPGALEMQSCAGQTSTCESTLIKVEHPGQLVVSMTTDPTLYDADLALFQSNAAGDEGEPIAAGQLFLGTEKHAVDAEPGYYLAVVKNEAGHGAAHLTAELLGAEDAFSVAAPEKKVTLSSAAPSHTWSGSGQGAIFDCGEVLPAVQPCDQVLVRVTEPGSLTFQTTNASPTTIWNYVAIYSSDKAGTKSDDRVVAQGNTPNSPNYSIGTGVEPGYYLLQMGWLLAANGTYDGAVTFTPAEPEE